MSSSHSLRLTIFDCVFTCIETLFYVWSIASVMSFMFLNEIFWFTKVKLVSSQIWVELDYILFWRRKKRIVCKLTPEKSSISWWNCMLETNIANDVFFSFLDLTNEWAKSNIVKCNYTQFKMKIIVYNYNVIPKLLFNSFFLFNHLWPNVVFFLF
jgi:hypothetical protein